MSRLLLCGPARRGIQPAPAPVLGTITDLSATAGVESASLSWTAAANATSHQPQYSDDGSTWSDFGAALSGAATSVTVTGLTASVPYSFRVIASDGVTQTISNVDTATPLEQPSGFVFGAGANEPANLLPFLAWSPSVHGIDMQAAHGDGFSGSQFSGDAEWYDGRMTTVADATVPGGVAMRQHWPTGEDERSGNAGWNFRLHTPDPEIYPGWNGALGELKSLYVRFMHYKESGWIHNNNNAKLIGFTMQHNDAMAALDAYLQDMDDDELWWRWQFPSTGGVRGASWGEWEAIAGETEGFTTVGEWYDIEFYIKAQSAPGVADGELHVWRNGVKVTQWNNVSVGGTSDGTGLEVVSESASATGYSRINVWPYYNGGAEVPKSKSEYLRWGGLYMSGAR